MHSKIRDKDRRRASRCGNCTLCDWARRRQRGIIYWLVKFVERRLCPFCRAYVKVYGVEPHVQTDADPEGRRSER